ncbi:uncharacterized protein N7515_007762 [Penicillium bovifimosum]|uniref:F-box domain-containing protein n=1 Tax=Penicillium bovifimosum TaxID=126998 RepID=A0A9W9GM29_9EURO|nr:uncharacterized protein N7515_007762 [Penicillium bovifimosum]KAJ5123937.1 hypothetical protein N7515_007762 [Penicillium bovifimosum]
MPGLVLFGTSKLPALEINNVPVDTDAHNHSDQTTMPFLNLPQETLRQIISYLSNRDVAALSTQCRTFHTLCDMATRQKYDHIIVSSKEKSIDNAFDMLMSILKNPTLGQSQIPTRPEQRGDGSRAESSQNGRITGPKEEPIVNMLMQRITKAGRYLDGQRNRPGTFICQALTIMLIVVSPNLTSMAFVPPCCGDKDFPLAVFLTEANASPKNKPYLRLLSDVTLITQSVYHWEDQRWLWMRERFFRFLNYVDNLLSIESVTTDFVESETYSLYRHGFKVGYSNISRIFINRSSLDSLSLAVLVSSFKVLREIQYYAGGGSLWDTPFDPKSFLKAMCRHKDTLEILDVDVACQFNLLEIKDKERREFAMDHQESDPDPYSSKERREFVSQVQSHYGTLKDFVALKRLSLGIDLLLYFAKGISFDWTSPGEYFNAPLIDCLPDSLEYLCVRGYRKGVNRKHDKDMKKLLAHLKRKKSGSSSLKEIKGIEETIPVVHDPNHHDEDPLIWALEPLNDSDSGSET